MKNNKYYQDIICVKNKINFSRINPKSNKLTPSLTLTHIYIYIYIYIYV